MRQIHEQDAYGLYRPLPAVCCWGFFMLCTL